MPNATTNDSASPSVSETETNVSSAMKLVEQTQSAVGKVRAQIDEIARLMSELARINAVFESVADRLANATFKSSIDATSGAPPYSVVLSFIEELGDLAKRSAEGTRDIRRELRNYATNSSATAVAIRQTESALQGLTGVLKQIEDRNMRSAPAHTIEIETRIPPTAQMTVAALAKAVAAGVWVGDLPKTGGYKN